MKFPERQNTKLSTAMAEKKSDSTSKKVEDATEKKPVAKKTTTTKKTTKTETAAKKAPAKKAPAKKAVAKKAPAKKVEEVVVKEAVVVEEAIAEVAAVAVEAPGVEATEDSTDSIPVQSAAPVVDSEEFLKNFNWHNYQEGIDVIEDEQLKEFEALVTENFVDTAGDDVVDGFVVHMTDREAIIDINAKSEGVISLNEFRYNPDLKVGDKVEVIVDIRDDKKGQ